VTVVDVLFPPKLRRGDMVRVVAPARSRALVSEHDHNAVIETRFAELGLKLTFGEHVDERDSLDSSSVSSRVDDLHSAFVDPEVAAVLTVIGGFNSNELLPHLDWELIGANPKVFCGFSDITALQNAIFTRTGMVTYSGPHWSSFGMREHFDQNLRWFTAAMFDTAPIELSPSASWTDDLWFLDQDVREVLPNEGWWKIQPGEASGRVVGGNLCTLNLLQGTPFMPNLAGSLLMIEDDFESTPANFARDLTSLLQLPDAAGVQGVVVGRFQRASGMTQALLERIVRNQPALLRVPVLANADFGHTSPMVTFPIGGRAAMRVGEAPMLTIAER
jgi:muramoyltetrapeptide carboxypeptidase